MTSDQRSLKSTGGLGAKPKVFSPADLSQEAAVDLGEEVGGPGEPGPRGRLIAIIAGILVVLAIAAAAAYFFVLPIFSPDEPEVTIPPPAPEEPTAEAPPSCIHQSYFTESADATREVELTTLGAAALQGGLRAEAGSEPASGSLEEISFVMGENPASSEEMFSILLPSVNTGNFTEDVTGFVYYDDAGAWPGYVFQLDIDADRLLTEEDASQAIESRANLTSFYLEGPGTPDAAGFRDGAVGDIETRYLPYSASGASFNYGWVNGYLVISSSFRGFQEAVALLAGA